jgi:hypothetical protein
MAQETAFLMQPFPRLSIAWSRCMATRLFGPSEMDLVDIRSSRLDITWNQWWTRWALRVDMPVAHPRLQLARVVKARLDPAFHGQQCFARHQISTGLSSQERRSMT